MRTEIRQLHIKCNFLVFCNFTNCWVLFHILNTHMKKIFDSISEDLSKVVTEKYSTSFSIATKLIDNSIRQDIYNVYGKQ